MRVQETLPFRMAVYAVLVSIFLSGWFFWTGWRALHTPLMLATARAEFQVASGSTARQVASQLSDLHILEHPRWWLFYARITGQAGRLQSGDYALTQGMNALDLLHELVKGRTVQYSITFIDGWTFAQVIQALDDDPHVKHTLKPNDYAGLIQKLGGPRDMSPEGWFFPNTYFFSNRTTDVSILKRAYEDMRQRLNKAWLGRAVGLPLKTPYDALILASMVEKETSLAKEQPLVASVFINRLRLGMRLQSDPTVIYALGNHYHEHLTFKDLRDPSPYNTYIHTGLPPTPISLPSGQVIWAVTHPANSKYLYFVATGKGNHVFSKTYPEQQRAVIKYQLDGTPQKNRANLSKAERG